MDTPVSKTADTSGHLPVNLFFKGLDYKFKQDRSVVPPTPARVQIVRARQDQMSELRHLVAKFQRTIQAALDADQHGAVEAPADLLVALGEDITAKAQRLYKDIQDARARYLGTDSPAPVETSPASGDTSGPAAVAALATELQRFGGPLDNSAITVTVKPTEIHHPRSMAEAMSIRNTKLNRDRA